MIAPTGSELLQRLDSHWQRICRRLGNLAFEQQIPLYLVGGIVRDLLLGYGSIDFDFVLEGDATAFARQVQDRFGGEITIHPRFKTAAWRPADAPSLVVDLVTARREQYAHPAALPDVTPADLHADLFRRDFTINTLAIRLDGEQWGTLIDPYEGRRDLARGSLRVLHEQSFVDDPTRIWRGVRFEQRFGFAFEPQTAALLQAGLPHLTALSADRVRHELQLIMSESDPWPAVSRLAQLGALQAIVPQLVAPAAVQGWWAALDHQLGSPFLLQAAADWTRPVWRLLLLLLGQKETVGVEAAETLRLTLREQKVVREATALYQALQEGPPPEVAAADAPPSVVERWISRRITTPAALPLVALALTDQPALAAVWNDRLQDHLLIWSTVKPHADGRALQARGLPPGPRYREILDRLRAAWLDGEVDSAAGEAALLDKLIDS